jgi:hypothetical protein
MPPYFTDESVWMSMLPIPATILALVAASFVVLWVIGKRAVAAQVLLPLSAFGLLGMVAGYLTGLSRESAVGAVVPAVLTLMGGVAAVLVARAANWAASFRVSGLIATFSVGLLVGSTWGAAMRQSVEDFATSESELLRRSHVEAKVREFRDALKLPPEMPAFGASEKSEKSDKSEKKAK